MQPGLLNSSNLLAERVVLVMVPRAATSKPFHESSRRSALTEKVAAVLSSERYSLHSPFAPTQKAVLEAKYE